MRKLLFCAVFGMVVAGSALPAPKFDKTKVAPLSARDAAIKKCEVHGDRLQKAVVPIVYGRAGAPFPFATEKRDFPHANSRAYGGCIVSEDSPGSQAVKFCPACRAAEKRWLLAHKMAASALR